MQRLQWFAVVAVVAVGCVGFCGFVLDMALVSNCGAVAPLSRHMSCKVVENGVTPLF
jgi:hypothetical protein